MIDDKQTQLYSQVLIDSSEYVQIAFAENKQQVDKIESTLFEILQKMMSVYRQAKIVENSWQATEQELIRQQERGLGGIIAGDVRADIENFLAQGKGALDIFANQFLRQTAGFNGKWHHDRIKKHLRKHPALNQEIVQEIERILNDEWDGWLEDFCADRDQHHEQLFDLSPVKLIERKTQAVITRRNGTKIPDVVYYVEQHYENLSGLLSDLIWLICVAKVPALKSIRLNSYHFIKKEIAENQQPEKV